MRQVAGGGSCAGGRGGRLQRRGQGWKTAAQGPPGNSRQLIPFSSLLPMPTTACPLPWRCSIFMGNIEVPTSGPQVVKMSLGTYEFGANLVTNKGNLMLGRFTSDGRLTGRVK